MSLPPLKRRFFSIFVTELLAQCSNFKSQVSFMEGADFYDWFVNKYSISIRGKKGIDPVCKDSNMTAMSASTLLTYPQKN